MITTYFSEWFGHTILILYEFDDLFRAFLAPDIFLVEFREDHRAVLMDIRSRSIEFYAQLLSEVVKRMKYLIIHEALVLHQDALGSIALWIVNFNVSRLYYLSHFDLCCISNKVDQFEVKN